MIESRDNDLVAGLPADLALDREARRPGLDVPVDAGPGRGRHPAVELEAPAHHEPAPGAHAPTVPVGVAVGALHAGRDVDEQHRVDAPQPDQVGDRAGQSAQHQEQGQQA